LDKEEFARVSVAIDLSRAGNNPLAEHHLRHIIIVGKEVDLLEVIRRTERRERVSKELVRMYAISLGIDSNFLEEVLFQRFVDYGIVEYVDDQVIPTYSETSKAYAYGIRRLKESLNEAEENLLTILVQTTHKPIAKERISKAIEDLSKRFRAAIEEFLISNKIVVSFTHGNESYLVSPRLYKDEKKFQTALEILQDNKLDNVTEFLQQNPGNLSGLIPVSSHISRRLVS
jgi:hypothetical protein